MAAKKKAANATLPTGYKKIGGGGPAAFDFKTGGALEGTVIEKKTVPQQRKEKVGKKTVMKTVNVPVMIVADKDGELHSVWESAGIKDLIAAAKPKQKVFIRFDGQKKLPNGNRFNAFTCGLK